MLLGNMIVHIFFAFCIKMTSWTLTLFLLSISLATSRSNVCVHLQLKLTVQSNKLDVYELTLMSTPTQKQVFGHNVISSKNDLNTYATFLVMMSLSKKIIL